MKTAVLVSCCLLAGCSTLGELDALNDAGSNGKRLGEVLRTTATIERMITSRRQPSNSASINRTYGAVKQMPYHVQTGNIPIIISETQDVYGK